MERIGGRGAQSGDGRTLISRRSRHRFRGVIRFTGGFVSKSYFDADRFFAFIGEAARQGADEAVTSVAATGPNSGSGFSPALRVVNCATALV